MFIFTETQTCYIEMRECVCAIENIYMRYEAPVSDYVEVKIKWYLNFEIFISNKKFYSYEKLYCSKFKWHITKNKQKYKL